MEGYFSSLHVYIWAGMELIKVQVMDIHKVVTNNNLTTAEINMVNKVDMGVVMEAEVCVRYPEKSQLKC